MTEAESQAATQEQTQAPATEEEKKHDVEYADEEAKNAVSTFNNSKQLIRRETRRNK